MARKKMSSRGKGPAGRGPRTSSPPGRGRFQSRRHGGREWRPAGVSGDDLVAFVYRAGSASMGEIMAGLGLSRGHRKEVHGLLADLCHRRQLRLDDENQYTIGRAPDLFEGVVSAHPRGFAFASLATAPPGMDRDQDLFIPRHGLATATHGDRVLLQLIRRRGRPEGRVVQVLERAASRLVGIYTAAGTTGLVKPEDERYAFSIVIHKARSRGARNGEAVVAEITEYRPEQRNPVGRIIEVLGDPDDVDVQTEMTIRKFDLPHAFSDQALRQARALDDRVVPAPGRLDLRDVLHVTIDGETARDFDDAVAVLKTKAGFRLYVSIADVSHYVTPGSALDLEAYQRGTSVYFPTRVVPMLPERLSNNLCSLVPDQDRPAFTAILDFDRQGRRLKKRFSKSIIRSRHRLTYTLVRRILVDRDQAARREYNSLCTPLKWMGELAAALEERRTERGSIGFEIPEARVVFDQEGEMAGIVRLERNQAHKLIEEFMLAANEAVAETLAESRLPALYRIHEVPDPVKVAEFAEFAHSLGLKLPDGNGSPRWFGKVLTLVAGTPKEYIVSNILLRAMKQARYSAENVGHFGLAAPCYTHFTSPIRRYPDLMVHRTLARILSGAAAGGEGGKEEPLLAEAGEFLSKRERVAVDAERELVDRLKVRFMRGREGERFKGIISGVTSFGLFVELVDLFISGAVALTDLTDDYYRLDEKNHRLIGRHTNRLLQIGDLVVVRLKAVNVARRRIDFLLEEPGDGGRGEPAKS